ncbi:MAG: hypothetical protein JXR51_00040 [Bacteroidales bacterium]|nr:hypothetical protein [Bacteroidales bacterium]
MKEIELLQNQITKLEDKSFDLDAWKINTINLFDRIFGNSSSKINQINELKYDFSSWALRDTSGTQDTIKKKAKVIVEAAIFEIENFGLEKKSAKNDELSGKILEILSDELKGSQFKALKDIIESVKNEETKSKKLKDLLEELQVDTKEIILSNIIGLL